MTDVSGRHDALPARRRRPATRNEEGKRMTDSQYVEMLRAIREHSGMELAQVREAGEHGADAGWPGFTYTADGADFFKANRDTVWAMLADDADEYGVGSVAEFVGTFARADMTATADGFDCLCAWYTLETVGRRLADRTYDRTGG